MKLDSVNKKSLKKIYKLIKHIAKDESGHLPDKIAGLHSCKVLLGNEIKQLIKKNSN